jgi:HlyD family secretion protein
VGSQVSGNILELDADFNSHVKKGQLVAGIDPQVFQARVTQASAGLEVAKSAVVNGGAVVQRALADLASAKAGVADASASVLKAKVGVVDAKSNLDRAVLLYQNSVLDAQDKETAQATYDTAVAMEQAAEAEKVAADQKVLSAEADAEVARHVDVGQTVTASLQAPTLFEIAQDLTKMQVDTNVSEADVGRLRVGQSATFTVDAYPGEVFRGQITQIRKAPISVQNVVTYDVVVGVSNPDLKLFPGMTATVRILVDRHSDVLRVPNSALRFRPAEAAASASGRPGGRRGASESTLWVLHANGRLQSEVVQTG